jgi:hypothetical protein
MPSLQDQLSAILPEWEREQQTIEQTKQVQQNPKATMQTVTQTKPVHRFKPTNNASRETFNAVRDVPGQKLPFYVDMLERKGFKHNTTSSLLYQMIRQGSVKRGEDGGLVTMSNEYAPIKSGKGVRIKNPAMVKTPNAPVQPAAGIAALPPQAKPAPRKATHSLIINHNWDAQKEVDKLSVTQARALYDLLKKIFGG